MFLSGLRLVVGALALQTVAAGGRGDSGFATCSGQFNCLSWTLSPQQTASKCSGAQCEFTVCVSLALGQSECTKSGGISHTIPKVGDCSTSSTWMTNYPSDVSTYTQCQTGPGGSSVNFIFKDAGGCTLGASGSYVLGSTTQLSCRPTVDADGSPTGGMNVGGECLWTVTLPSCSVTPTPPTPDPCASVTCAHGRCNPSTGTCVCTTGYQGVNCNDENCPLFTQQWPGYVIVDSADVPGCGLESVKRIVDGYSCQYNEKCGILHCDTPAPPSVIAEVRACTSP